MVPSSMKCIFRLLNSVIFNEKIVKFHSEKKMLNQGIKRGLNNTYYLQFLSIATIDHGFQRYIYLILIQFQYLSKCSSPWVPLQDFNII